MRWTALLPAALALPAGFAGAALWSVSGLGNRATHDYLLANPEVLPQAIDILQKRAQATRIGPLRADLERPFPGAVLGNPAGKVTLVEFSDYACTYCRASVADVNALIAANPDLRVVVREYPILHPESVDAARMALAAAQQGQLRRVPRRDVPARPALGADDCGSRPGGRGRPGARPARRSPPAPSTASCRPMSAWRN